MARRDGARGSTLGALCFALGVTAALVAFPFLLGPVNHGELALLVWPLSCIWAAWDSRRIGIHRYRTRLGMGPYLLLTMLCWWIVVFPWYLYVRYNIVHGRTPRKREPTVAEVFE